MTQTQARGAALVTGGAKRIGRAISMRLAREGFALALHSSERSRAEAEATCNELTSMGAQARVVTCDLACDDVSGLVAEAQRHFGYISTLVNNASLFERDVASP